MTRTRVFVSAAALCAAAYIIWLRADGAVYNRFTGALRKTDTVLIEMDQRTQRITMATAAASKLFERDIVGLDVREIIPMEYREAHDSALANIDRQITNGTFEPRVSNRYVAIRTPSGKKSIHIRIYVTGDRMCYAVIDMAKTEMEK